MDPKQIFLAGIFMVCSTHLWAGPSASVQTGIAGHPLMAIATGVLSLFKSVPGAGERRLIKNPFLNKKAKDSEIGIDAQSIGHAAAPTDPSQKLGSHWLDERFAKFPLDEYNQLKKGYESGQLSDKEYQRFIELRREFDFLAAHGFDALSESQPSFSAPTQAVDFKGLIWTATQGCIKTGRLNKHYHCNIQER